MMRAIADWIGSLPTWVVVAALLLFWLRLFVGLLQRARGQAGEKAVTRARVVGKSPPTPNGLPRVAFYMNGSVMQLQVSSEQYELLKPGQKGILTWSGQTVISFVESGAHNLE